MCFIKRDLYPLQIKLFLRYYDGDQDALFKEAHIINPYKKPNSSSKVTRFE